MKARILVLVAMTGLTPAGAFGFDSVAAPAAMVYFEKRFGADIQSPPTAGLRFDVQGRVLRRGALAVEPVPALMDLRLAGTGAGPVLLLSGVPLWQPARVFRIEGTAVGSTGAKKNGKDKMTAGEVARGLLGLALLGGMSAYALKNAETSEERVETVGRIIQALGS